MPLKPSVRLPRRFNRPVTKSTRRFVSRKHVRRKEQKRERFRRTARRFQRVAGDWRLVFQRWVMVTLGCFLLLFAGLIVFSPIVQVREIRVARGDLRIDAEKVQRSLAPIFGRHLLFLSTQEVSELLRASVPDIGSVTIGKSYPSRLTVHMTLEPVTAKLIIVSPDPPPEEAIPEELLGTGAVETGAQDFLTVSGRYIVHPNPIGLSDLPTLTIVDWGVRPSVGQLLVPPDFLEAIFAAEETVREQFAWETAERVVYIRAREFHLKTDNLTLWMDLKSPLTEQFARFKLFLKTVPPGEAKEYVDLRLSDRIVYK